MARNRTRAERREAKQRRAELQERAVVLPAAVISSSWLLIANEFMKRPPYLLGYQAASLRERSLPIYQTHEGFTFIY
jgi:hypothetical protein